jgi:hypothetical protein
VSTAKDTHNQYRDDLIKCYDIVADYIRRNARILVGGMAIDFALKAVGDKLYDTLKIDYDFITPSHHTDAYNLGNILAKSFPDISVIVARHASTMRVRYKFMPVADITYVPDTLYDRIKFVSYEGFKVIHPHFQMIDQMRALTFMAENPPSESYLADRLGKDIKRFCMLSKYYGFDQLPAEISKFDDAVDISIDRKLLTDQCLGGFQAAIYWLDQLRIESPFKIKLDHSDKVQIHQLATYPIGIFSDDPDTLITEHKMSVVSKHRAFLDKLPEYRMCSLNLSPTSSISSTSSLSIQLFNSNGDKYVAKRIDAAGCHVMGIYGTMVWLLMRYLFDEDVLCGTIYKKIWYTVCQDFNKDLKYLPDPITFFGQNNWSESYLIALQKRSVVQDGKKITGILPKNAYLNQNGAAGETVKPELFMFDPKGSDLLFKDGGKVEVEIK